MLSKTKHSVNFPVILFLCSVYLQSCLAVIYQLNETEYQRMPPVFLAEPYEECAQEPAGVYCALQAALVADGDNALLDLITEYSEYTVGHYNHSLLRYNLCITNTCKEFFDNTTTDLVHALEACLNKTIGERYGLYTTLSENNIYCKNVNENTKMETADLFMITLLIGILIINTVGSLYDFICTNGKKDEGILLLTTFSVRRNWRKLMSPPFEGMDPRLERLKGLSFMKFISTTLVIMTHSLILSVFFIDNTKYTEDMFQNIGIKLVISSTIIVQTFFIISGTLLSYNLELMSERDSFKVNWTLIPKGFILRWLRLTPPYAFVIFLAATVNKYIITGPHWHTLGAAESADCRRYWWQHLLYIHNYNDESQCMPHTWYLACDAQLCVLGLVIYVACRSAVSRKVVLSVLMVIATLIPVGHVYWQDLNGILVVYPETVLRFFVGDPTFSHLYKRGHTNMLCYLVGLGVGFLFYHGQKVNFDAKKYRKYRLPFYSVIPLGLGMSLSGCVFYREGPKLSLAVSMFFAAYQKPVWGLCLGAGMLAVMFKFEVALRAVADWHGWTVPSRLSYCAYLLHLTVVRVLISQSLMPTVSILTMFQQLLFILVVSYMVALPTWLLVEQPAGRLFSALLRKPRSREHATDVQESIKEQDKKDICDEHLTRV